MTAAMNTDLEKQIDRVLYAFRKAANRAWGPEEAPRNFDRHPCDARTARAVNLKSTARGWVKGSVTPLQKIVWDYLGHHPEARAVDISKETGVNYTTCKAVKREHDRSIPSAQKPQDRRKRPQPPQGLKSN